jgi:predicted RNase H-like HicB family nuclease
MAETKDRFDGYAVSRLLDADGNYLAHFVERPNVSAFGPTPEKALTELDVAWALVKDLTRKKGSPYQWLLRGANLVESSRYGLIGASTESSLLKRSARVSR